MSTPKQGEKYRHSKTGAIYTIICLAVSANNEVPSNYENIVCYQSDKTGNIFYRSLAEFKESVELHKEDGAELVPRFEKLQ